jgi:hypothetical protein
MLRFVVTKITSLMIVLCFASIAVAQNAGSTTKPSTQSSAPPAAPKNRVRFIRAFVVDDRLSALRRDADLKSPVMRRLSLGRPVYVIESQGAKNDQPKFYRVAVSRRTRGWIHDAAIAIPTRVGEDARALRLITERFSEKATATEIFHRMLLCKLVIEKFSNSKLVPKAMILLAQDAERAASLLNLTAQKHPKKLHDEQARASLRDFYLSDASLDRYTRLGVHFDYLEKSGKYLYDGQAHRDLLKRFPNSEQAAQARKQLEITRQKLAQK